ncbi:uncharacterized protein LOC104425943 isoform X1 [Eucalyptus grandis]|uniref:uncharacterized protein LOC104425943 isoform X1 n=1 Tax=Eucalyptus grandis TaxID=71139 RepID=UPI00192E96F6|nr:uncharacterized protein LOC104425943 isoform X1 [Eucalyptus grandis]XP_039161636.1 uncharacterized protein LOC104425943 isoform X1 [Eucalyptus grandis]XP_039161637.1 uncharacterized protein LOC104425943 isoform X1 [Eucalyptus grandis]
MARQRISSARGAEREEQQSRPIDNIAKHSQQRRGPPPKRRSDFSFFTSSSASASASSSPPSSMSTSDYSPRFSNGKDGLSNVAAVSSDEAKDSGRQSLAFTPVKCCKSWMLVAPNKFQGTESSDVCMTRVSVVLERTDYEVLSPAELQASNEDHASRVQQLSSPDEPNNLDRADPFSGGCIISNLRSVEDDSSEKGRGKRKRKPRSFFSDDLYLPPRSPKKVRRYRIMRYLGLMAPVGSPYSVNN